MAADDEPCCKPMFWIYLLICVALVMFAGLMSGLTLGLMSLSQVDLEVLIKAGQPQDRKNAAKILPIMKNQHLLLCTLLIGNAMAMEALPIFLDALLPAWGAILISVTLILAFGEIIPQAVCSRYGLSVGAKMVVVVRLLVLVFFPISYPISKILDCVLGKGHFALLRRAELKTLVDMHGNEMEHRFGTHIEVSENQIDTVMELIVKYQKIQNHQSNTIMELTLKYLEAGKGGELTHDETTIITGALDLTQKTAKDAMTPIFQAFSLDINSKLDMRTMGIIMTKGHSRVPIYSGNPTNIFGLILIKNLITCRPEDETPIRNLTIRKIPRVHDDLPLYVILNEFQKGNSHMAVVVKSMKDVDATLESVKGKIDIREKRMKPNEKQTQEEEKDSSSVHSSVTETPGPLLRTDVEQCNDIRSQLNKWEQRSHDDILDADLESFSSYSADEEVIGIITMEDVIEELLQEEIFDETDEYVDVHNKIRINMQNPRRSSSNSPSAISLSHFQKRTPVASPLSSYHHTPILNSPVYPYSKTESPGPRPYLSNSPAKSLTSSPAELAGHGRNSPASHRVSRKPYEKLQKLDGVEAVAHSLKIDDASLL